MPEVHELAWNTQMMVSAIILFLTFGAIFTESIHKIDRTKVSMIGAAAMIFAGQWWGFYNPELALEGVDWNVILLLGAMMTIIEIMIPTGGFQAMAYRIASFSKGRLFLLMIMLGAAISGISMLLDNVTTIVIFGPLIVLICQTLQVNPVPYLMAGAMLSNIGGVATLVGDPPNLMIGSAAGIDFNTFLVRMSGMVFACWVASIFVLRYLFRNRLRKSPKNKIEFTEENLIEDPVTWYSSLGVLAVMVVLFMTHSHFHWEAWVVAALGMTCMLFVMRHGTLEHYLTKIDLTMLLFFVCLFMVVGGVEHSHFLQYVAQFLRPVVEADMLTACIVVMWVAAIVSAAINNIPFMAALIPIIVDIQGQGINVTPLWWALALGVGVGGNGTHIGASANIFVMTLSEKLAAKEGKASLAITPGMWIKKGMPLMLATLVVASLCMILFFDFYNAPIQPAGE